MQQNFKAIISKVSVNQTTASGTTPTFWKISHWQPVLLVEAEESLFLCLPVQQGYEKCFSSSSMSKRSTVEKSVLLRLRPQKSNYTNSAKSSLVRTAVNATTRYNITGSYTFYLVAVGLCWRDDVVPDICCCKAIDQLWSTDHCLIW